MKNKFHIITLGCQMNKSDSERIAAVLQQMGMDSVSSPQEADLIILNSCMVRQSAEHRIYGQVKNFKKLKKQKPNLIIGVTGCMPGQDKDAKLKSKMPGLDLYFPISELTKLPSMLKQLKADIGESTELPSRDYLDILPRNQSKFHAFVVVSTGCDQYCSYCVVPYARGRVRHRPVKQILREIKKAATQGYISITLLGQIVNNYQAPDVENFSAQNPFSNDFARLLWEVEQIPQIQRIFWTAPHPVYMNDEIIRAFAFPKQVNYLHLPVQSGSNRILKKMNRGYSREDFIKVIEKVKKARPGIALGTDIIIGFPGETEQDFGSTLSLYREVGFDIAYPAMYSPRPHTASARAYADDIPGPKKKRRWQEFDKLMREITFEKNKKFLNQKTEVLVEEYKQGICWGRSNEMKLVSFASPQDLTGTIQNVIIKAPKTWVLEGELA